VTLWERGVWDDQDERIVLDRRGSSSVESLVEVPEGHGGVGGGYQHRQGRGGQKIVAVGLDDGRVRFVRLGGANQVLHDLDVKHDEIEGVLALGFDVAGRMVSGGGQVVKVWHEAKGLPGGMRNGNGNNGSENNSGSGGVGGGGKHGVGMIESSDEDEDEKEDDDDDNDDSSDEERREKTRRKKRKRNRGKDKSGGRPVIAFSGL